MSIDVLLSAALDLGGILSGVWNFFLTGLLAVVGWILTAFYARRVTPTQPVVAIVALAFAVFAFINWNSANDVSGRLEKVMAAAKTLVEAQSGAAAATLGEALDTFGGGWEFLVHIAAWIFVVGLIALPRLVPSIYRSGAAVRPAAADRSG